MNTNTIISKKEQIIDYLKEVYDPEISINIYDLGLIYEINIDESKNHCDIVMTLTSAFCPAADEIIADVHHAVTRVIESCDIRVTFDPPFSPDNMSDDAKLILGFE